jgi:hypothetical protein
MKKIALAVLVAMLGGCAVYVPGPYYGHGYSHHGYFRY